MKKKFLIASVFIHLSILALALILLYAPAPRFDEVPIELSEILTARLNTEKPKPSAAKQAAPRQKSTVPSTTNTEAGKTLAPAPSNPNAQATGEGTGPVAEEYEVADLPVLLKEVRIPYPANAKARGIQGAVVFEIIINSNGDVQSAKVIESPSPLLTGAAADAVAKFKFKPARLAEKSVAIKIRYTYRFLLQ